MPRNPNSSLMRFLQGLDPSFIRGVTIGVALSLFAGLTLSLQTSQHLVSGFLVLLGSLFVGAFLAIYVTNRVSDTIKNRLTSLKLKLESSGFSLAELRGSIKDRNWSHIESSSIALLEAASPLVGDACRVSLAMTWRLFAMAALMSVLGCTVSFAVFLVTYLQVDRFDQQNQLLETQNKSVQIQNELVETNRRVALSHELTSVLDQVAEATQQPDSDDSPLRLPTFLTSRIVTLSRMLQPYRTFNDYGEMEFNQASRERAQLLLVLNVADLLKQSWSTELVFKDADLSGVRLNDAVFRRLSLTGSDFSGCHLSNVDFSGSELQGATFNDDRQFRDGQQMSWRRTFLNNINFQGANLGNAHFGGLHLNQCYFRYAILRGADFRNANLETCDFREAILTDCDFDGASLRGARLEGALVGQIDWLDQCGATLDEGVWEVVGPDHRGYPGLRLLRKSSHPDESKIMGELSQYGIGKFELFGHVNGNYAEDVNQIDDWAVLELSRMRDMLSLDLSGTSITDVALATIASMPKLESIDLSDTKVTDSGISELADMQNVRTVNLSRSSVGNESLRIVQRFAGLINLNIANTKISDKGLPLLSGLNQLSQLILKGLDVTDEGVKSLGPLANLTTLILWNTEIGNEALRHLPKNIEILSLRNTSVDDKCVRHLLNLPNLMELDIAGTEITEKGRTALLRLAPTLKLCTVMEYLDDK